MTDKEKIRAEVEKCISNYKDVLDKFDKTQDGWVDTVSMLEAKVEVLTHIIYFIDSLPKEPVSKDLEEAAIYYANTHTEWFDSENNPHVSPAFKAGANWQAEQEYACYEEAFEDGAKWQKEQFEKERLKNCDSLTKEEYEMESDFVIKHLKKNNRTPTFCDAIEYGMRLQKEQMMKDAIEVKLNNTSVIQLPSNNLSVGDKVWVIKED